MHKLQTNNENAYIANTNGKEHLTKNSRYKTQSIFIGGELWHIHNCIETDMEAQYIQTFAPEHKFVSASIA